MKKINSVLRFEILSTIFIIILGSLLHFTFAWSNNNLFVGSFSAVNESVWEHLKLLFFPMLITIIFGYFYLKDKVSNYICSKTQGLLLALSFIVVFFYTYTGIIGTNLAILDIGSFVVAVILGEYYTYVKIKKGNKHYNLGSVIILLILLLSFIVFTFFTPHIGLFLDPITGRYGI